MVIRGDARSLDYRSLGGVVRRATSGMEFLITSADSPLGFTVWASTGVYLGGRCRMRRISQVRSEQSSSPKGVVRMYFLFRYHHRES